MWATKLEGYPDRTLANIITQDVAEGFRVCFKAGKTKLVERSRNMKSAEKQEEVVEAYIEAEQAQGRIILAGTPTEAQEMGIHCSAFGVIPKKHKPGKYRLILNLSAPEGNSVNDGIDRELASLSYVSVEEVAGAVAKLGRGA